MKRNLICVIGALLIITAVGRSAEGAPVAQSPTTAGAICANFDCTAETTLTDTYEFAPAGADGTLTSFVAPGIGAFTGRWVYLYQLAQDANSSENLGGLSVDFRGLFPPLTSLICSDCGAIAGTGNNGTQSPSNADYTDEVLEWFFLVPGKVPPGVTTTFFGAISDFAPRVSKAVVLNSVQIAQPDAIIPVPEPGSLMLLGTGIVSLVGAARRRRRKV